jgi:hypothetical protein
VTLVRDDVRRGANDKLCIFVCLANSDKDEEINEFGEYWSGLNEKVI